MKSRETLKELRSLSAKELEGKILSTEEELLKLRFRHASRQLEQTAQLRELKRNVARMRTVLNESVLNEVAVSE